MIALIDERGQEPRGRGGGAKRRRPPGSLLLLLALLLGLGAMFATTAPGSAIGWALYGVMAAGLVAVYRLSQRGELWRAIENRTGMDRIEFSARASAILGVSALHAVLNFAYWLYATLLVIGIAVSGLLWTMGPRDALRRPAAVLAIMLRVAPVAAALAVAGLLGAAWWLIIVVMCAGFAAVNLVDAWRDRAA